MRGRPRHKPRPPLQSQANVIGSPLPSPQPLRKRDSTFYRSTSLETRSRTPSPSTTTPSQTPQQEYYGTANLTDRSRSPSPATSPPKKQKQGRKLPTVPLKPSSLNLAQPKLKENMPRVLPSPTIPQPPRSPGSINFPRLNASPTHGPNMHVQQGGGSHYNVPPPPGKLARPEPYSPTERNNLNKISVPAQSRTLPSNVRTSIRERDPPSWNRDRSNDHYSSRGNSHSPDVNRQNSQPERSKFLASHFDERSPQTSPGRGSGTHRNMSSSTLPNGFKPKGKNSKKPEKLEMRSDSNIPLNNESDDDDDEDWC